MKNLILICGNEEYLKEQKKQELLKALNAEGSVNFNSFTNENLDLIEIRGLIDTLPLFEDFRKILISESGLFKMSKKKSDEDEAGQGGGAESAAGTEPGKNAAGGAGTENDTDAESSAAEQAGTDTGGSAAAGSKAEKEMLQENQKFAVEVFSNIPESTVVIFVESNVSALSPMYKLVKKTGEIFKFETVENKKGQDRKISEQNIRGWVSDKFKAAGRRIDGATVNYLVQLTGYDMEKLSGEIEKLICFMLDKPAAEKITARHVDAICSRTLQDRVFAMLEAKLKGNISEATSMLEELFALKVAPMKTLYLLVRQYNQALSVRELMDARLSDQEIMARTELKDWQLRRIKEQITRTSARELRNRLEECADMEYRVKSGSMTDRLALELLIIQ